MPRNPGILRDYTVVLINKLHPYDSLNNFEVPNGYLTNALSEGTVGLIHSGLETVVKNRMF